MTDAAFLRSRIVWRFRRHGAESAQTKLVDAAPVDLAPDELPVVLFRPDPDHWALLTTRRVITCTAGALTSIDAAVIRTIRPLSADFRSLKKSGGSGALVIMTDDGIRHEIQLEGGAPFFGFWNASQSRGRCQSDASRSISGTFSRLSASLLFGRHGGLRTSNVSGMDANGFTRSPSSVM